MEASAHFPANGSSTGTSAVIFRFDRFQADDTAFRLTADGAPVPVEPKALRLLLYLIENRGRLVRKQELLDAVWADAAVTESALTRSIGLLRKTLEDDSREPRFIETVPTAGYRFIAQVESAPTPELTTATQPPRSVPAETISQPAPRRPHLIRLATIVAACFILLTITVSLIANRLHPAPIRSLAVLPLDNLSGDPSQEYFADGMTDELTTEIARIPNLRVASRTSVMAHRDNHRPLPETARELDVDAIVEGSIVRSGDRIRITAQLIDARTDRHLWAQSFEGPATDVLSLQDNVAQQIAQQARLVLTPPPPRPPVNPAAHDAYLRGRYFFNKQDFAHSLEYYQQAISLDPNYASAYAGYSSVLDGAAVFDIGPPEQLMPKALAAAQRAIQLDPQNGEAYTELGSIQTIYLWDWTAAGQNLTRGIELNPNDSVAEFKYAVYLDAMAHPQDAVAHMRRAVKLDPLSFFMNRRLGATLYLARDHQAALSQLNRAAEMEHQPVSIENYISLIYEQMGKRDDAIAHDLAALHAEYPRLDTTALLSTYQQHGWLAYWRVRSQALLSSPPTPCSPYEVALDDLRIDDLGDAFASFNGAADRHCYAIALIRVDPALDPIRQDPRYTALLTRLHQ